MGIEQHYHQETTKTVDTLDTATDKAVKFTSPENAQKEKVEKADDLQAFEDMYPDMFPSSEVLGDPTAGMTFKSNKESWYGLRGTDIDEFLFDNNAEIGEDDLKETVDPETGEKIKIVDLLKKNIDQFTIDLFDKLSIYEFHKGMDDKIYQEKNNIYRSLFSRPDAKIPSIKYGIIGWQTHLEDLHNGTIKEGNRTLTCEDQTLGAHNLTYHENEHINLVIFAKMKIGRKKQKVKIKIAIDHKKDQGKIVGFEPPEILSIDSIN